MDNTHEEEIKMIKIDKAQMPKDWLFQSITVFHGEKKESQGYHSEASN